MLWVICLLAGWARSSAAAPRLALVDGTEVPFLHEALRVSLQPWSFEVVDWPRGADARFEAAAVARNANARYVVWYDREAAELVVYDAALDRTERRSLAAEPKEPADAGAVALSVKTMLRLPAAPPVVTTEVHVAPARWRWTPAVQLGPRVGLDGDSARQLRVSAGLEVMPPGLAGARFGVLAELGSSTSIDSAGFKGDWSEWSVMASVSKRIEISAWRLTTRLAGGVSRATLDGEEKKVPRTEATTRAAGTVTVSATRAVGAFSLGVAFGLTARGATQFPRDTGQALWTEPHLLAAALAVVELEL